MILCFLLTTDSVLPDKSVSLALSGFAADQRFNWIAWEAETIIDEAGRWLQGRVEPGDEAAQKEAVMAWLERQGEIHALEAQTREEYAQLPQNQRETPPARIINLETALSDLRRQQEDATPQVEAILAYQVSQVLRAEGFVFSSEAWPPVTFRFEEMPTYLIISPRNEISTRWDANLLPALPDTERETLEKTIEAELDVSALVDDLGGLGSWPTMVRRSTSLAWLVDTVAHEWAHNYLIFHTLGINYYASRDLKTMNETVASVVGEEVGQLVLARYYPELLSPPEQPSESDEPAPTPEPDEFSESMRKIRLRVDELLAEGRVEEAESFMEAERQKLVEKGYTLRRLNQAYFAFHGSYATSSTSVDPIGPWINQLREQNASLKSFLEQVSKMDSLDDLLSAIGEPMSDEKPTQ